MSRNPKTGPRALHIPSHNFLLARRALTPVTGCSLRSRGRSLPSRGRLLPVAGALAPVAGRVVGEHLRAQTPGRAKGRSLRSRGVWWGNTSVLKHRVARRGTTRATHAFARAPNCARSCSPTTRLRAPPRSLVEGVSNPHDCIPARPKYRSRPMHERTGARPASTGRLEPFNEPQRRTSRVVCGEAWSRSTSERRKPHRRLAGDLSRAQFGARSHARPSTMLRPLRATRCLSTGWIPPPDAPATERAPTRCLSTGWIPPPDAPATGASPDPAFEHGMGYPHQTPRDRSEPRPGV